MVRDGGELMKAIDPFPPVPGIALVPRADEQKMITLLPEARRKGMWAKADRPCGLQVGSSSPELVQVQPDGTIRGRALVQNVFCVKRNSRESR